MAEKIVFCADGTWNSPDKDANDDHMPDWTNVYKFFLSLDGALSVDSLNDADEQEKSLAAGAKVRQVAKYIHGVGDSRNPVVKLLGGALGAGVIARIVRGYTFISRNYEPGAQIYIVGFSRGAYTARALAGLIASQGLLAPQLTADKELAYRRGAAAWYRYRQAGLAQRKSWLGKLRDVVAPDLPAFVSSNTLKPGDLVPDVPVAAVGVWDTVGAMGVPIYALDKDRIDAFKFADTQLNAKVSKGFHAIALDERRADFSPTLWDDAPNVEQMLFPGAHADVGGGYPTVERQSELSDGALLWMIDKLQGAGVLFAPTRPFAVKADATGTAHRPWDGIPFKAMPKATRKFRKLPEHPSIAVRVKAPAVLADPKDKAPAPYAPTNRP